MKKTLFRHCTITM